MNTFSTKAGLKKHLSGFSDKLVGFVPTMGCLHKGHLALVKRSLGENDHTVVSIFVNPLQFGPNEDFDSYPRQLEQDLALLEQIGAHTVFTPSTEEMALRSDQTKVVENDLANELCGRTRPTHFDGVLTIVAKLFNIVRPNQAYFGEKDLQQCRLIEKMTRDLDFGVNIVPCPIEREADGLALSSRNRYLSAPDRERATNLFKTLGLMSEMAHQGEDHPDVLIAAAHSFLQEFDLAVDYLEIRDFNSLSRVDTLARYRENQDHVVALIAAKVGNARLIDNKIIL